MVLNFTPELALANENQNPTYFVEENSIENDFDSQRTEMDTVENEEEDNLLTGEAYMKVIVPLHNSEYEVIAYYITFTSDTYAVVNNNRLNLQL